jgi:hypothetical protein
MKSGPKNGMLVTSHLIFLNNNLQSHKSLLLCRVSVISSGFSFFTKETTAGVIAEWCWSERCNICFSRAFNENKRQPMNNAPSSSILSSYIPILFLGNA